jgi:acyl transferase domain-containing protein
VCEAAGVDRASVVYVEAHGTGTVVGDAQELGAIDRMYGAGAGRSADAPLLIGSVKSNMGHCEGCSGLAGAPTRRLTRAGCCMTQRLE